MPTISTSLDLTVTTCGECGVHFAMPEHMHTKAKRTGKGFWCPNGHNLVYSETEIDRLRKQVERVNRERDAARTARDAADDQRRASERSNAALRGELTKSRKRAAAGTCPCCKRTFQQLSRHMAGQHPEFVSEQRG